MRTEHYEGPVMIEKERIRHLNSEAVNRKGEYVLYWMHASQRTHWNPALEYAIETANNLGKPLITLFGLTRDFPDACPRDRKSVV